jgi:phage host-nuclease inhibitor protein Gam
MANKTTKKTAAVSREAYEAAVKDYVNFNNEYARLAAARDAQVAKIDADYGTKFEDLKASMEEQFEVVKCYAEENRDELFTETKSLELFGAKLGFRISPPKVTVMKGFKLKDVVERLAKLKVWQPYVRVKQELNKDALLAQQPKGMEKHGLMIEQEEVFYLEPEKTEVEA